MLVAENVDMSKPHVISIPGSAYAVPPAVARNAVLMSNNTLYVTKGYERNEAVRSYIALLEKRLDQDIIVEGVDAGEIAALAGSGSKEVEKDFEKTSSMQAEVLKLLKDAVARRASDIHFVNRDDYTTIRYRIDGVLRDIKRIHVEEGKAMCSTIYMSMLDQGAAEYSPGRRQDGRIHSVWTKQVGLAGSRVATRPLEDNNLFVLRLQHQGSHERMSLKGLGYSDKQIATIKQMMIRNGVNLFSGPTGSGKTTSLFVCMMMLLQMHNGEINLMTVEHPIEINMRFSFGSAVQTPLKEGEKWEEAIENMMRLDPDYLMVGEIRQFNAAMAAIQGAMTGHGLWTTTHAKHSWASLDRLADLQVPMGRLSDASLFTGLVNQALSAKACTEGGCAKPYIGNEKLVREDVRERIEKYCDFKSGSIMLTGAPNLKCPKCGGLGYYERTVLAEVVQPTQKLMNIFKNEGSAAARAAWIKDYQGMTLVSHAIDKINAGLIDPQMAEEALHCGLDEDDITMDL